MATSILAPNTDYTAKDFDSIKARLVSLIQTKFPTWTDFEVINFANIFVELVCHTGDNLAFAQDNNARESRFTTSVQRRNILAHVKLIDYKPALATAATVDQTFTFTGLTVNVNIPAGQVVKTTDSNPTAFQVLSPAVVTPGSPTVTLTVENSATQTQTVQGTGQGGQTFTLGEVPFLEVVSIVGASSGLWTEVDDFLLSAGTDKVFTVSVDNNEIATIAFGNGSAGLMPTDILTITYKIGGGASGNVAAESITSIDGAILDVGGNPTTVTTINASAAGGGADPESVASIKAKAPASIHNPVTSIARTDFEDNAVTLLNGVTRALMLTRNEVSSIPANSGLLYILPQGDPTVPPSPGFPSAVLLAQAKGLFFGNTQSKPLRVGPLVMSLRTVAPTYTDITVHARITMTPQAKGTTVTGAVTQHALYLAAFASLEQFFSPTTYDPTANSGVGGYTDIPNPAINFGYYLQQGDPNPLATTGFVVLSDIMNAVRDTPGVRSIGPLQSDFTIDTTETTTIGSTAGLSAQHVDVPIQIANFPRFAGLTLIDAETGNSIS